MLLLLLLATVVSTSCQKYSKSLCCCLALLDAVWHFLMLSAPLVAAGAVVVCTAVGYKGVIQLPELFLAVTHRPKHTSCELLCCYCLLLPTPLSAQVPQLLLGFDVESSSCQHHGLLLLFAACC